MKRLFTLSALTSSLLVAGGLSLASCNDDLDFVPEVAPQSSALQDGQVNDLTRGWNLLIWNADTLEQCGIPLNTELPVVVKSKNSNLSYEQVLDSKGRPVLRPHFTCVTRRSETLESDQLHLYVKGHPELGEKVVNLFVHPYIEKETRADEKLAMDKDQLIKKRAYRVFRYGINYNNGVGTSCPRPWFNFSDALLADLVDILDPIVTSTYEEHQFDSISQNLTHWDLNASFGGSYPATIGVLSGLLSGSISGGVSKEDKTTDRSHFLVGIRNERAKIVTLNWLKLINIDTNNGLPLYFAYLEDEFKDALNNPGSPQYKYYNFDKSQGDVNQEDGIYRLLKDFGTAYPTQATLGGRGKFTIKSEEQIDEHSLSWHVSFNAEMAKSQKSEGNIDTASVDGQKLNALIKLQEFRNSILDENDKRAVKFAISYGRTSSQTHSSLHQDIKYEYLGGKTGAKPSDWIFDSDHPDNWAILEFLSEESPVAMPMKSIEQFIYNKEDSTRLLQVREALKNRYYSIKTDTKVSTRGAADNNDGSVYYTNPFYHYLDSVNGLLNNSNRRMVLADLVYVRTEKTKQWQPLRMAGPDKKVRTYYPVRANVFSPEFSDINYRLNTDGYAYVKHFMADIADMDRYHNKYNHAWYYALDYEDECPGVLEIQFSKEGENAGWYRSDYGVRNDDGQLGDSDPFLWVALKLGDGMDTPYEDKIKAIGFYAFEGPKKGCVFGASPMWNDLPTNASAGDAKTKVFKELWQKEYDKGNHTSREFATYPWRYKQNTKFKLVWSKEPLTPIRSYYKVVGGVDNTEAFKKVLPRHLE